MSYDTVRWPEGIKVRPIEQWPWPTHLLEDQDRRRATFSASWGSTLDLLDRELYQVDARTPVLQLALDESAFRLDGYPRAQARAEHPGVILSFDRPRVAGGVESLSFPCDRFDRWQDNVRAIALALEALRRVDRYGITPNGEQYTGWRAIGGATPMPAKMSREHALATIARLSARLPGHYVHDADMARYADDPDEIRRDLRTARGLHHPDRNDGDRTNWDLLEQAAQALGLT